MNIFSWDCRQIYYAYNDGIYNLAELLFYVSHSLKSYEVHDKEVKTLMIIIKDAMKEARWRDDLDCYNEWSRHTRFSFLSEFDDSPYWKSEEVVSIDDKPFVANYQPIDVITSVIKNWGSIYDHPYLYTMVTHLLEASCDLTTPPNFDERIKYFIYRVGRLYGEAQGLRQEDGFNESAYAWIRDLTIALATNKESKGRVQRPLTGALNAKGAQLP